MTLCWLFISKTALRLTRLFTTSVAPRCLVIIKGSELFLSSDPKGIWRVHPSWLWQKRPMLLLTLLLAFYCKNTSNLKYLPNVCPKALITDWVLPVTHYLKDPSRLQDERLAAEVAECVVADELCSPLGDVIKQLWDVSPLTDFEALLVWNTNWFSKKSWLIFLLSSTMNLI